MKAPLASFALPAVFLLGCNAVHIGKPRINGVETGSGESDPQAQNAKPKDPQVKIDDLVPRVAAATAKLGRDPSAASELAKVRTEILDRKIALEEAYVKTHVEKREAGDGPEDAIFTDRKRTLSSYRALSPDAERLLHETTTRRAALWASEGKAEDTLRELVDPELTARSSLLDMPADAVPTLDCEHATSTWLEEQAKPPTPELKVACERARKVVSSAWPKLCWNQNTTTGCQVANEGYLEFASTDKSALLTYATVSQVTKKGDAFEVKTLEADPRNVEVCKGQFQTDKILDIDERRILVERTTWCKSIAKERRTGIRIVHRLGKTNFTPKRGDFLLLLVDPKKVKVAKAGEVVVVTTDSPSVVAATSKGKPVYRWNELTP